MLNPAFRLVNNVAETPWHFGERKLMESDIRVSSVKDFVEKVCEVRDSWIVGSEFFDPWFRGQTSSSWPPEPGVFRYGLLDDEDEIRDQFQRKGPQYMTELPPEDHWGWYFLMQHYGAPTRLLDWTDSALIALFFALNSAPKPSNDSGDSNDECDAVVWMLNPWWLNKRVIGKEEILLPSSGEIGSYLAKPWVHTGFGGNTRISPRYPVAIDPPFIARRIAVQRSHFTIFGHDRAGLLELSTEKDVQLIKIIIASEGIPRMRADLGTLGVTDTSVYPDLHGLADELTRYRSGNWPL